MPSPCAPSPSISTSWTLAVTHRSQQELCIAGASADRRGDHLPHTPTRLSSHPLAHQIDGPPARHRIAHYAALAHRRTPRFELWLDQCHEPGARTRQRQWHRQRLRQGNETHVGDERTNRLGHQLATETARVAPLEHHHPGIFRQARMQLVMTDINRVNARRAPLEQHLREPPRGGPYVERDHASDREAEVLERGYELQGSTRDMVAHGLRQANGSVGANPGAGPALGHSGNVYQPAANAILRSRTRRDQAQLDQEVIETRPAPMLMVAVHCSQTFDPPQRPGRRLTHRRERNPRSRSCPVSPLFPALERRCSIGTIPLNPPTADHGGHDEPKRQPKIPGWGRSLRRHGGYAGAEPSAGAAEALHVAATRLCK